MAPKASTPTPEKAPDMAKKTPEKKATKVQKPQARKRYSKKYLQALQRPVVPSGKRYPVRISTDGLVEMQPVPDYLANAVERNAKESPLLRLPEHIRKKIWDFALYEGVIEIYLRDSEASSKSPLDTPPPDKKPDANNEPSNSPKPVRTWSSTYYGTLSSISNEKKKPKQAWNLPATCRQIYNETATLIYSLNTFVFAGTLPRVFGKRDGPDGALEGWITERSHAQLHAIRAIRPHWMDMISAASENTGFSLKHLYPGLKKVVCAKRAVGMIAGSVARGDPMRMFRKARARGEIGIVVQKKEGMDVKVVF
ncbi:hypothetical protein DM02DRAFT_727132 [Periconia macrospinosa]|uniref:DUF7730 domain-containing protein n=1 Tax=Periconia macrospinosa TaxID=97972 RepID=A0A2V1DWI6_9PLEO|nr:hypothetical protein DM02DRAFT_727132 [Periconia macrospinosa]